MYFQRLNSRQPDGLGVIIMAKITQKLEIFVKEVKWRCQYRSGHREYYWRMRSFVHGPALFQRFHALNVDIL